MDRTVDIGSHPDSTIGPTEMNGERLSMLSLKDCMALIEEETPTTARKLVVNNYSSKPEIGLQGGKRRPPTQEPLTRLTQLTTQSLWCAE